MRKDSDDLGQRLIDEDYTLLCDKARYNFPPYFAQEIILNARLFPWFNSASNKFLSELELHYIKSEGRILSSIGTYFEMVRGTPPREDSRVLQIVNQLKEKGYCVVENAFPSETIEQFRMEVATRPLVNSFNCNVKYFGDLTSKESFTDCPGNYRTIFVDTPFTSNSVLTKFLFHDLIRGVSDCYFGVPAYVENATLFISNPNVHKNNDVAEMSTYSQAWHYDLSQLKWLNFFIYLSDVEEGNGAHQCVEKTHTRFIPGTFSEHFLPGTQKEYEPGVYYGRFSDTYIEDHYEKTSVKTHVGRMGTLVIEDTRCLHRATPVLTGRREMLQLNTSISSLSTWRCSSRFQLDRGVTKTQTSSDTLPKIDSLDSYLSPVLKCYRSIHQKFESQYSGDSYITSKIRNAVRKVQSKGRALFSIRTVESRGVMDAINPRVVASVEARMGSSRLPGKVLKNINGVPALTRLFKRLSRCEMVDAMILATTENSDDDELDTLAQSLGIPVYRGSEDDVLNRVVEAQQVMQANIVVEVCGDTILLDPGLIDMGIRTYLANDCDVVANVRVSSFPQGADVQVFALPLLAEVEKTVRDPAVREHVSLYFYEHPEQFRILNLIAPPRWHRPDVRLQLDYQEDLQFIREIYAQLEPEWGDGFGLEEILQLLQARPELEKINSHCEEKPVR